MVGALLQGACFVALGVLLFLPWFDTNAAAISTPGGSAELKLPNVPGLDTSATAWEAFDGIDVLLMCLATAGVVFVVLALVLQVIEADGRGLGIVGVAGVGCAATAATIALVKVIDPPGDADVQPAAIASVAVAGAAAVGGVLVALSGSRPGADAGEELAASPPGWYSDPYGAAHLRYWDGTAWTDHTQAQPPSG